MPVEDIYKIISRILMWLAVLVYLLAVFVVTQQAFTHENFVPVLDANGEPMLNNDGSPQMRPSDQPENAEVINIAVTSIGGALALNFGAALGISLSNQQAMGIGGGADSGEDINIFGQTYRIVRGYAKPVISMLWSGFLNWDARLIGVVIYLIALVWMGIVFVQDGGLNADSGTIPDAIKNSAFTLLAVLVAVFTNLNPPQSPPHAEHQAG